MEKKHTQLTVVTWAGWHLTLHENVCDYTQVTFS